MLSLASSVRIYLCLQAADMRRSFDGLACMVEQIIGADPHSGHLFVFRNRRGDRLKVLYWDRDGLALWYKRLEQGTFCFPPAPGHSVTVSAAELAMILEGMEIKGATRRTRYKKVNTPPNF